MDKVHRNALQLVRQQKFQIRRLWRRWAREELPSEQTIGQILQHLIELEERIGALEKRLHQLAANQKR